MTSSSPSNRHLKLLAGADRSSVLSIREQLSAAPKRTTVPASPERSGPARSVFNEQAPTTKFETWQDLWARDHNPQLSLNVEPAGAIVFHQHVPAIKLVLEDGKWTVPKANPASSGKVLVKGKIYTFSILNGKKSELPENVKSGQSWGMIGEEGCWGLPYTEEVKAILESIARHNDTPPWSGAWSLVRTSNLAAVVAFGSVIDTYNNYKLAEVERSGKETVVLLAESGGDKEESVVLSYGTKAPSTHLPIGLAGRTSK